MRVSERGAIVRVGTTWFDTIRDARQLRHPNPRAILMRILCAGDIHIGRRPSRLPTSVNTAEHSCAAAWRAIVDTAIRQRVRMVALSGDLVDQRNSYFEAADPLESGLRKLAAHGIQTVAVSGNHDHEVLPRLADRIGGEHFHLLGRGGRWERRTFRLDGEELHVDGWSFPSGSVSRSPLSDYSPDGAGGVPVLGLLHAELGATAGRYAPVSMAELQGAGCAFWLLGHVHAPQLHDDGAGTPVLYPGSPQPMDPGEPGWHGAWLLHLEAGRRPRVERLPVATVRYDTVSVSLDGLADPDRIEAVAHGALSAHMDALLETGQATEWLSCRVRVVGRCGLRAEASARLAPLAGETVATRDGSSLHVEQVSVELRPALDLEDMARGNDAPALLARLLYALDSGPLDPDQERLLRDAEDAVLGAASLSAYQDLPAPSVEERGRLARAALRRQADALLETLLSTRAGA